VPKTTHIKPIEAALTKVPNRFLLTVVAARRWESIVAGAPPLVPARPGTHPLDVVLKEIVDERIEVDHDELEIRAVGEPMQEVSDEPIFSEAISADSKGVKDLLNDSK
jgi:DNA-directed RNA polymerase subunit K/omega